MEGNVSNMDPDLDINTFFSLLRPIWLERMWDQCHTLLFCFSSMVEDKLFNLSQNFLFVISYVFFFECGSNRSMVLSCKLQQSCWCLVNLQHFISTVNKLRRLWFGRIKLSRQPLIKCLQHIHLCLHVLMSYGLFMAVLKCWDVGVLWRVLNCKGKQVKGKTSVLLIRTRHTRPLLHWSLKKKPINGWKYPFHVCFFSPPQDFIEHTGRSPSRLELSAGAHAIRS